MAIAIDMVCISDHQANDFLKILARLFYEIMHTLIEGRVCHETFHYNIEMIEAPKILLFFGNCVEMY